MKKVHTEFNTYQEPHCLWMVLLKIYAYTNNSSGSFFNKIVKKEKTKNQRGGMFVVPVLVLRRPREKETPKEVSHCGQKQLLFEILEGFIGWNYQERTEELFKVQLGWFKVGGQIHIFRFFYMIAIPVIPTQKKLQELLIIL